MNLPSIFDRGYTLSGGIAAWVVSALACSVLIIVLYNQRNSNEEVDHFTGRTSIFSELKGAAFALAVFLVLYLYYPHCSDCKKMVYDLRNGRMM